MNTDDPRCVAFIFARGGSKGVPGKNLKELAGRPLIAHSIDVARVCGRMETVIVSTDDPAIAEVARAFGAAADHHAAGRARPRPDLPESHRRCRHR